MLALMFFGVLFILVGGMVVNGWALSVLWDWFMVPAFGLPHLAVSYAIGISVVIGLLTHQRQEQKKYENMDEAAKGLLEQGTYVVAKPLVAVLVGWIITWFLPK